MKQWIDDLLGVIFPNICEICGRPLVHGEDMVCLHCLNDLPFTTISNNDFNEVHKRLAVPGLQIEKAASWCWYVRETDFARLIQRAKYNNRPLIARKLARMFAEELAASGFFNQIDSIVPVPIATLKRLRRGYNQSYEIARGIADVTGLPVDDCLRVRHHSTQTRRTHYERWLNARSIYSLSKKARVDDGTHILLVDDVITSGATMVACLQTIARSCPTARLSALSLALTRS